MPTALAEALKTEVALMTARAKLPDDLALEEFHALIDALWEIEWFARKQARGLAGAQHSAVVRRVQYGSDFLVVLAIVGGVGGSAAGVILSLSKAIDMLAAAGLKNEERLGKKDERLAQREKRSRERLEVIPVPAAEPQVSSITYAVTKNPAPKEVVLAVDGELEPLPSDPDERTNLYYAVEVLAEYGVRVVIDED